MSDTSDAELDSYVEYLHVLAAELATAIKADREADVLRRQKANGFHAVAGPLAAAERYADGAWLRVRYAAARVSA